MDDPHAGKRELGKQSTESASEHGLGGNALRLFRSRVADFFTVLSTTVDRSAVFIGVFKLKLFFLFRDCQFEDVADGEFLDKDNALSLPSVGSWFKVHDKIVIVIFGKKRISS